MKINFKALVFFISIYYTLEQTYFRGIKMLRIFFSGLLIIITLFFSGCNGNRKNIVIAAGWLPGWSTDYDAVLLAKNLGVREIINMSNVDYVYDKDPKKHKNSKKIQKISWDGYLRLISQKWKAGMNVPFDPVAAKEARKSKMRVNIIGNNLKNLENLLDGKKFKGTTIE